MKSEAIKNRLEGMQKETSRKFTSQTIQLQRGDILYLSTDGFFDQHNMKRKKFGKKQFIQMLDEMKSESFENQRAILKKEILRFQRKPVPKRRCYCDWIEVVNSRSLEL